MTNEGRASGGRDRARRWRRVRRALAVLLLLGLAWGGWDIAYVSADAEVDRAAPADVILVLGCLALDNGTLSSCIQVRAGHAADLYRRGLAAAVIPSGGVTGPGPSEAAALAAALQADGVPTAAIFREDRARDTVQNISYSGAIMCAHGWHTAILVTDPHHIRRATLVAQDSGLAVLPSPATASASWHIPTERLHNLARDALSLMAYQARRALSFGAEPATIGCT